MRRSRENRPTKTIFPEKLWRLVNDVQLNSAIRWADNGLSFYVYENPLRSMCLGKENQVFFTQKPKSFVRQLHLYGFRKISKNQFSHQLFRRDQPSLVKQIKRSYSQSNLKSSVISANNSNQLEGDESTQNPPELQQLQCYRPTSTHSSAAAAAGDNDDDDYNDGAAASSTRELSTLPVTTINHNENVNANDVDIALGNSFQFLGENLQFFNPNPATDENRNDNSTNQAVACQNSGGALVFANSYGQSCKPPLGWFESNYVDFSYNYNDDSILTLYNNDIYPNTCEDNNITL